jgi:hypothetical protein
MNLITASFAQGRGGECFWCGRYGPGYFVGSPSHWIFTGIGLVTLTEQLLFMGRGTEKDAHVVTPEIFALKSGTTIVPSPKEEVVGW